MGVSPSTLILINMSRDSDEKEMTNLHKLHKYMTLFWTFPILKTVQSIYFNSQSAFFPIVLLRQSYSCCQSPGDNPLMHSKHRAYKLAEDTKTANFNPNHSSNRFLYLVPF